VALMVFDTSALVAILFREPDADRFGACLAAAPVRLMSAVTRVEVSCVVEGRKGARGRPDLELLLREAEVDVAGVTARDAEVAIQAFRRYGKGLHRAGLNIGDCFTYALAKTTGHRLLFKGGAFGHTDIVPALETAAGG
jgi:ribonuclease VapC